MSTESEIIQALRELGPTMVNDIHIRTGILKETIHGCLTKLHKNGDVNREFVKLHFYRYGHVGMVQKRQFVWSLKNE